MERLNQTQIEALKEIARLNYNHFKPDMWIKIFDIAEGLVSELKILGIPEEESRKIILDEMFDLWIKEEKEEK